jgi:hypothetical protein
MVDFNFGQFLNVGTLTATLQMAFWVFIVIIVLVVIWVVARERMVYKYWGEVEKRRQDDWRTGEPTTEIVRGKAGYIKQKNGTVFRIKWGWLPWQHINILKLPNPKYMKGNTAYFIQYDINELVQARKHIEWDYETGSGRIVIEPVDSNTKAAAKMEIKDYSMVFKVTDKFKENAGIIIMGFILVAGIISLYFVNKACTGG